VDTINIHCGFTPVSWPAQPDTASSNVLEEVVVTAQKREEKPQDVPIAITVVSA